MKRYGPPVAVTVVGTGLLVWGVATLDPDGVALSFLLVWVPMVWLGTLSRVAPPALPAWWHRLRPFEADGRVYELLGVRLAKRALRRGPMAAFNRHLHLPAERTPAQFARLDRRMRVAEASHTILFVATLGLVATAAANGWWDAVAWLLLFDVVMNGYPAMLQRYNRALLHRRFGALVAGQ
jgi:hypothetical protein